MAIHFRKESLKIDGVNYDSWKQKMKSHLLCMGPGYWLIIKNEKEVVDEDKLEEYIEPQRELFMCNMLAREALLTALLENEYN